MKKAALAVLYRRRFGESTWAKWRALPVDDAKRLMNRPHPGYELSTEGHRAK